MKDGKNALVFTMIIILKDLQTFFWGCTVKDLMRTRIEGQRKTVSERETMIDADKGQGGKRGLVYYSTIFFGDFKRKHTQHNTVKKKKT